MADNMVTLARQGYREEERSQVRKTEEKLSPMERVLNYTKAGFLNKAYEPFAQNPLTRKEMLRLPPAFKSIYNDLIDLNKLLSRDRGAVRALENQAEDWNRVASHFDTKDTSRVLLYGSKEYRYPARELENARREDAKFEAAANRINKSLNLVPTRTPDVLTEATERVETLRKVLTVEQPYSEMQEGLLPIELPVSEHIDRLQHAQYDVRSQTAKLLKEAGIDGTAILKESETHDPRSGRAYFDATDKLMMDAHETQIAKAREEAGGAKEAGKPSPTIENKGTVPSDEG